MIAARCGKKNSNYRGGFGAKCERCSNPVWVRPSKAAQGRWFCSKACRNAHLSEATTGPDHWRFQGGDVQRTCQACGGKFHQRRAEYNRSPGKYCSRACLNVGRRKRTEVTCELCYTGFTVKRHKVDARFCSRACKRLSQVKVRTEQEVARMKLNKRMGTLMWDSLRAKKGRKTWQSLAKYTLDDLMKRLESLFQPGMTWENSGREWHIDHIRPRSSFSYSEPTDPEFAECWALANLQPLWKLDNLRKGAKYTRPPDTP